MRTNIEKVIEKKLNVILDNKSLENSMVLHLDAYLQILGFIDSNDEKLKLKIEQMIDESFSAFLKKKK